MEITPNQISKKHWLAGRLPFYYGWIILPISILGAVFTSPGQTFMISVFNPSFRETFNISLSQLTGAYMLGTILASLPQPYIGVWMDKLGIRRMLFLVITFFTLACLFISQANSLTMLFFAFFFLRMFGQGALELLSVNMLPMWFDKILGRVAGARGIGVNLLIGIIPVGVLALINSVGWRNTYMLAAAAVFLIMIPLIYFFYINYPKEIGQQIDGKKEAEEIQKEKQTIPTAVSNEPAFTLKQAFKTRTYWILTISWFSWASIGTAITFNLLPIFTAKGLTEQQAAGTFSILMVVAAFSQIIGGFLADHVQLKWLASGSLFLYSVSVTTLILLPTSSVILVYVLLLGLAQGLFGGLSNTVWVRFYGRKNLGKISGSVMTAGVAGSSIGPFLMGLSYDSSGTFYNSLAAIIVILFILSIANLWSTPPKAHPNNVV